MLAYPPEHFHTLLVLDIDNTLIPETEPLFIDPYFESVFKYLEADLAGTSFEDFKVASRQAFAEVGCCVRSFAKKYGKDQAWIFEAYGHVAEYTLPAVQPHIKPDALLKAKLVFLMALGFKPIAFTQGHKNYAVPLIKVTDLDDILPEAVIHDIIAVNGALKREEIAYQFILDTYTGFTNYIMVEDSPLNLPAAFRMGFETHKLGPKPVPPEIESTISFTHAGIHETLDSLIIRALNGKGKAHANT